MTDAASATGHHPPVLAAARGRVIAFEFRVFGEAGEELGSNVGAKPRIFELGAGEMLPALEKELARMQENETRSIVLPPEEAYGPIRQQSFREFPLESIPEQARQVGRKIVGRTPDGAEDLFDVVEVRATTAILDMNHPLAGRTLRFELRVLASPTSLSSHSQVEAVPSNSKT